MRESSIVGADATHDQMFAHLYEGLNEVVLRAAQDVISKIVEGGRVVNDDDFTGQAEAVLQQAVILVIVILV